MKKTLRCIKRALALVLALAISMFAFTACDPGTGGGGSYSIKFNSNGGSEVASITFNVDDTISLPVPEKAKYTFAGWYSNEMLTGNPVFTIPRATEGDKEYWAKWVDAEYSITYKDGKRRLSAQAGWLAKYKDADVEDADLPLPETAVKSGYEFLGWFESEAFTGTPVTLLKKGSTGNKTFYSKWRAIPYEVTFETNIDGYTMDKGEYSAAENYMLPTPEKQDYMTFDGWYETSDFSTKKVAQIVRGGRTTGDKTYYAKWKGEEYEIKYNLDGGSFEGDYPKNHVYGKATVLVAPEKEGSAFVGWYENENFTGDPVTQINATRHEAVTLYAKYDTVDFRITYELNGGSFAGTYPQGYNRGDTVTLVAPEKAGCTFLGWYESENFAGNPVTSFSDKTENLKFYAKWQLISYTITYELNGGTLGGRQTTTYTVESASILLTNAAHTPTRKGYRFDGWYTTENFVGDNVRNIPKGSTGDKTFYAKWTIETYVVKYELGGGRLAAGQSETVNYTINDAVALPATDPTRDGYTFEGWFTDSGFTTEAEDIPVGSTGHRSIYAKWSANTYQITYDAKGGTMPSGAYATTYVTATETIWLPVPTLAGKVFGGWYETDVTSPDVTKVFGAIRSKDFGDKNFKALWLDGVLGSVNSQLMEAEHTDLTGKTGPGGSGSASEGNMISTEFPNASNGQSIPWTRGPGVSIDWQFTLDRDVTTAAVEIQFGNELGDTKTFTNATTEIRINGQVYTTSWAVTVPNRGFASFTITDIPLRAGYNIITITVLKNDLAVGFEAGGPVFDCLTVKAPATIGYTPIVWK